MNKKENDTNDLNAGLEYVKDLPGFDRGHPHYFDDPMTDHLVEICLQLAGEIWVNRDRQVVIEHLLAKEGKVTPDMIEAFQPDPELQEEMKNARRVFTQRIFGSLYEDSENQTEPDFLSNVVKKK